MSAGGGPAKKQLGITNTAAAGAGANAGNIYSSLEPQYQQEATNPTGYTPAQLSAMTTASNQGIGGATAGITGQGNLQAARTRNNAGISGALDQAAQTAQQTQSQNDLGIQQANANLMQQQQQAGLAGLSSLFGTETGSQNQLYGMGPSTLSAEAALEKVNPLNQGMGAFMTSLGTGAGTAALMCWIARAVYGKNDQRWMTFRNAFIFKADRSTPYRFALALYVAFGPYVAKLVKHSPWLKARFKSVFDKVITSGV